MQTGFFAFLGLGEGGGEGRELHSKTAAAIVIKLDSYIVLQQLHAISLT